MNVPDEVPDHRKQQPETNQMREKKDIVKENFCYNPFLNSQKFLVYTLRMHCKAVVNYEIVWYTWTSQIYPKCYVFQEKSIHPNQSIIQSLSLNSNHICLAMAKVKTKSLFLCQSFNPNKSAVNFVLYYFFLFQL